MGGPSELVRPVRYGALRRGLKAAALSLSVLLAAGTAQAAEITVAALGDSLTHGYGLPPEQGFVPRLQAWLRDRGHEVTVINAGVSGDTTAGGLSRIAWTLTPEVDALIVALGGNDLLRGIDPAASRANLQAILETGLGPVRRGTLTVNVEPSPGTLRNVMSPPISRARWRLIDSPRPVPPYCRVLLLSTCRNSSKMTC